MLPNDTGRYCNNCKKSVIDFTAKTDEEIQHFFINNFHQPVCARFKNTQIHRIVVDLPQNIFRINMPRWMRFLVACLIIFGISIFPFETTIAGKPPAEISFYQDEAVAAKKDKKPRISKKKKLRKLKSPKFDLADMTSTTLGFMPTPTPPINTSVFSPLEDSIKKYSTQISSKLITVEDRTIPGKESPGPTPYTPTEFILPSILMLRRKNSNNTMD